MTNSGFWHMTVPSTGQEEIFKEISHCDEIERIATYHRGWGIWKTVESGNVCTWRTRLWSLPNQFTVVINVKPCTVEWVNEIIENAKKIEESRNHDRQRKS